MKWSPPKEDLDCETNSPCEYKCIENSILSQSFNQIYLHQGKISDLQQKDAYSISGIHLFWQPPQSFLFLVTSLALL